MTHRRGCNDPGKAKGDWTSWKNRPHATGDDKKRKQAEAFEALNTFVESIMAGHEPSG